MARNRQSNRSIKRGRNDGKERKTEKNILIITDGEKTEPNYLDKLIRSLNSSGSHFIKFKIISGVKTEKLIETAVHKYNFNNRGADIWIVLDRDLVPEFNNLVFSALAKEKKGILKIAWSNPCLEVFFEGYFRDVRSYQDSKSCIRGFSDLFLTQTKMEYNKNDEFIYNHLVKFGDEEQAIHRAKNRLESFSSNGKMIPEDCISCSTVYQLIEFLKSEE